ncbi:MAG TPA: aspartyl protease family protein [Cellvibrio sp.]|nr:aspartyl protease family protein [Cellvibrio sp.]
MTTRFTLISITLGAFALGFAASEYRHSLKTSTSVSESIQLSAPREPHYLPSKPALTRTEPHQTETETTASVFSWERVDQLIALSRFEEAIRLLQSHLAEAPRSARGWFLLAQAYEKIDNHEASLEAWFRYLDYEVDALRFERAMAYVRQYLLRLYQKPNLISGNSQWLLSQLNELLEFSTNDAELHVVLASLYAKLEDNYQAQYHAMMAVNDPAMQQQAEDILAELNGTSLPDELNVPLVRFGNQYLVNVTIEGYPARLLLDTGASLSGVSNVYTAKYPFLVKSTKPIRLNTASGTVDSVLFTVDTLRIDELAFNQHILALLPMHNMTEFDGLLGVDILGKFDFVIDQNAAVLRLRARHK